MRRLSFQCAISGHDDSVRRAANRLYLECRECGRTTPGWNLGPERMPDRHTIIMRPRWRDALACVSERAERAAGRLYALILTSRLRNHH